MKQMHAIFDLPHRRARTLLQTGAPVYLSVNPVEYHGPHLSLHNDRLVSEGMIAEMHARLRSAHPDWPLLVATDLEIGVDPTPGPGSRHTPLPIARRMIFNAVDALADLGAQKVVLMTFHGSPLHSVALDDAVARLRTRGVPAFSPMSALLWELARMTSETLAPMLAPITDETDRHALLQWMPDDLHAGFLETSLAMHFAPNAVSSAHAELPPCPKLSRSPDLVRLAEWLARRGWHDRSAEIRMVAAGLAWNALRPFPGYTSMPHLAHPRAGAWLADQILTEAVRLAEEVFAGGPPLPRAPLAWLAPLTLGGRLPMPDVPLDAIAEPDRVHGLSKPGANNIRSATIG